MSRNYDLYWFILSPCSSWRWTSGAIIITLITIVNGA